MQSRHSTGSGDLGAAGDTRGAFDVPSFLLAYHLSRSKLYKEIAAGRLRVMKVGTRTLISRRAALDWERLCEGRAEAAASA
jgi:hypothetical protein